MLLLGCRDTGGCRNSVASGQSDRPPFRVSDDAKNMLFIWFDAKGFHQAERVADIPPAHRQAVRVDSLRLTPEKRLDADHVFLVDLRQADAAGSYPITTIRRAEFDDMALAARSKRGLGGESTPASVVVYGASWCGACRTAAGYLRHQRIPFVEKDIERDDQARDEMVRKLRRAGIRPSGSIPVIDVRGTMLQGFDPSQIERLLQRNTT